MMVDVLISFPYSIVTGIAGLNIHNTLIQRDEAVASIDVLFFRGGGVLLYLFYFILALLRLLDFTFALIG
jgi:hypothetical protein